MKYTDTELETILSKLIASTRSPRGRFSAVASYPQLEKRLKPHIRCLFPTRMRILAAAAAVILLCLSVGTVYLYMQPTSLQTVSTMAETRNVILPDGSSVLLNRHSSLSYPKRTTGKYNSPEKPILRLAKTRSTRLSYRPSTSTYKCWELTSMWTPIVTTRR